MSQPSREGDLGARDPPKAEGEPRPDAAWERYMASCTDYIKRQLIVYQNWPQRRWGPRGYRDEKVFTDMNN